MPIYDPAFKQEKPEPRAQEAVRPPWSMAEPWRYQNGSPIFGESTRAGVVDLGGPRPPVTDLVGNLRDLVASTPYDPSPAGPTFQGNPGGIALDQVRGSVEIRSGIPGNASSTTRQWSLTARTLWSAAEKLRAIADELDVLSEHHGEKPS